LLYFANKSPFNTILFTLFSPNTKIIENPVNANNNERLFKRVDYSIFKLLLEIIKDAERQELICNIDHTEIW
jgi:hypothetical protein